MTWLALFWKGIRRRLHAAPNWEEGSLVILGNQQSSEAALMNTAVLQAHLSQIFMRIRCWRAQTDAISVICERWQGGSERGSRVG